MTPPLPHPAADHSQRAAGHRPALSLQLNDPVDVLAALPLLLGNTPARSAVVLNLTGAIPAARIDLPAPSSSTTHRTDVADSDVEFATAAARTLATLHPAPAGAARAPGPGSGVIVVYRVDDLADAGELTLARRTHAGLLTVAAELEVPVALAIACDADTYLLLGTELPTGAVTDPGCTWPEPYSLHEHPLWVAARAQGLDPSVDTDTQRRALTFPTLVHLREADELDKLLHNHAANAARAGDRVDPGVSTRIVDEAVDVLKVGALLSTTAAAQWLHVLCAKHLRDAVLMSAQEHPPAVATFVDLARRSPQGYRAPAATIAAILLWQHSAPAQAAMMLEHARSDHDPTHWGTPHETSYRLADLLEEALLVQMPARHLGGPPRAGDAPGS